MVESHAAGIKVWTLPVQVVVRHWRLTILLDAQPGIWASAKVENDIRTTRNGILII